MPDLIKALPELQSHSNDLVVDGFRESFRLSKNLKIKSLKTTLNLLTYAEQYCDFSGGGPGLPNPELNIVVPFCLVSSIFIFLYISLCCGLYCLT